jgi:hypothetical protein
MAYYPDEKLALIALGNLNGGAPSAIVAQLGAVAHGQKVVLASERKEIGVAPDILSQYVGTYQSAPTFSIAISLEDGHLAEQATNQPKFPLFAESQSKFFLKVVDAEIEFFKNDQGQIGYLVLHQNGQDVKGVKQ